jgi:hypothetical protein
LFLSSVLLSRSSSLLLPTEPDAGDSVPGPETDQVNDGGLAPVTASVSVAVVGPVDVAVRLLVEYDIYYT